MASPYTLDSRGPVSAYLRVFQPLEAFPPRRAGCTGSGTSSDGRCGTSRRHRYADHVRGGQLGVLAPADGERRRLRVIDGRYLRVSVADEAAGARGDAVVPRGAEFDGPVDRSSRRRREASPRSGAREAPPARPAAVRRSCHRARGTCRSGGSCCSRRRAAAGGGRDGRTGSRYLHDARARRCAVPRRPSRCFGGPSSARSATSIVELHQWLAAFDRALDPRARLRRAVRLMLTWDELDDDHSARDIHEALEALERRGVPPLGRPVPGGADALGRGPRARGAELASRAWPGAESNCRHRGFQPRALPTELPGPAERRPSAAACAPDGLRSRDLLLDREVRTT